MPEKLIKTKDLRKNSHFKNRNKYGINLIKETKKDQKFVSQKRESKKSLLPAGRTVKEKEDGHGLQKDRTGNL